MIHFIVEREVRARPEEVFDWFAEFSDRDYTGQDFLQGEGMKRAVTEQDGTHAVFTDHYSFVDLAYRAEKLRPTTIRVSGVGRRMNGNVVSTISPAPEGARIRIEFNFEPLGGTKLMAAFMKGHIEKAHIRHVDAFLKEFYAARAGGEASAGPMNAG